MSRISSTFQLRKTFFYLIIALPVIIINIHWSFMLCCCAKYIMFLYMLLCYSDQMLERYKWKNYYGCIASLNQELSEGFFSSLVQTWIQTMEIARVQLVGTHFIYCHLLLISIHIDYARSGCAVTPITELCSAHVTLLRLSTYVTESIIDAAACTFSKMWVGLLF